MVAGLMKALGELPYATADLPGVGGQIGPEPEDFRVDEIPAYLPSGSGDHVYVRVRKRGLTTQSAVALLARAAVVKERDIGHAGMKDKHAVTTQWFSLPRTPLAPEKWSLPVGLELLEASRHVNKLRTGHLIGNRFTIALTGVDNAGLVRAQAILERLAQNGLYNYFGQQRFGMHGDNMTRALAWLRGEERVARHQARFLSKLYPSVIQAEVFNRYVVLRIQHGLQQLLPGEVVRLEGTGSMFIVEDPEREGSRFAARDLHLTGPITGPKMLRAQRSAREIEERALREAGLEPADLDALGRHVPGSRRDLLVFPKNVDVAWVGDRLAFSFELPAGSYATVLVREVTRADTPTPPPAEDSGSDDEP
ncbi:MAG TPA: tRNA pseudouridine(13) synthase TruD [Polyangiaceae bacterium]|nr:tRNA pseudouridine(13) synthase TruD [Polyangiaceae bacterium]